MTLAQDSSVRIDYTNDVSTQAWKFVARTLRLLALILQILMSSTGLENTASSSTKGVDVKDIVAAAA